MNNILYPHHAWSVLLYIYAAFTAKEEIRLFEELKIDKEGINITIYNAE